MSVPDQTLTSSTASLEQLVSKYERPLQRFLRRRMASDEDASDATQEVFLRLARPGARQAAKGRERAYLFTTARNLLIDRHRRWEAQDSEPAVPLAEAEAVPAPDDTEQLVLVNDTLAVLRRGLASLRRRNREVFILHRFANMGYRQIAEQLGVSERTVERRMSVALSHLRRTLERSAESEAPSAENV